MIEWLKQVPSSFWWGLGILSLVTLLVSALVTPRIVRALPVDYFVFERGKRRSLTERTKRSALGLVMRNVLGWILFLAGVLMCFVPGQGLLTMLIGLTLVNFPGKRRLECWIFRRFRPLRKALNWMRRRGGIPAFEEDSVPQGE